MLRGAIEPSLWRAKEVDGMCTEQVIEWERQHLHSSSHSLPRRYVYLRAAGPHRLAVAVTAESGGASATYVLVARKLAPPGDARLESLSVSVGAPMGAPVGVLQPVFDPDASAYQVQVRPIQVQ